MDISTRTRAALGTTPGRVAVVGLAAVVVTGGILLGAVALQPSAAPGPSAAAVPSASPAASPSPAPSPSPTASPSPTPDPNVAYEHLSGIQTTPDLAGRYPIAVMIDDSPAARPQAGLSEASLVWQAPAEGGIPRYMAVFQSGEPPSIGPVRSARLYFVNWAAEWRAVYLHAGGPPPLRAFLASSKAPVKDVNGRATSRVGWRSAPHNLYTAGTRIRKFAERERGATPDKLRYDPTEPGALQPFRDPAPDAARGPDGASITLRYTSERVDYRWDAASGTWSRQVDGRPQHDAVDAANRGFGAGGTGPAIAPTSVVVMVVPIKRSASIEESLGRLDAASIGQGDAWVFADGKVQTARWSKPEVGTRTRFLDASGKEIALPRGQIFVQVVPARGDFSYTVPPAP